MPQPLPLFPNFLDPRIDCIFRSLCEEITPSQITDLNKQINAHLQRVRDALGQNEFIDLRLAEQIVITLDRLISDFAQYPESKHKLIAGAARYFIYERDAQRDFESILGFDDDVAVLNYVLKELGRDDLRIEL
jgi:uncharacterized membrane protein YkvA (DUF1232 family)